MRNHEELSLDKEDRLPWLEPVEPISPQPSTDAHQLRGLGLALVGAGLLVAGGLYWMTHREVVPDGDGSLIKAPAGPYKVLPDQAGGMTVEGQGDAAFAASEGADANGQLDLSAEPEAPLQGQQTGRRKPDTPLSVGQKASASVAMGGVLVAPKPTVPSPRSVQPKAGNAAGTGLIQLGTYSSEAAANQAYSALAERYAFLSALPKLISKTVIAGKTFYELRLSAGPQSADLCARLRAGGASCSVVK